MPQTIDQRLREAFAMAICWAEWPRHDNRTDNPAFYWASMPQEARERYYPDAETVARLFVNHSENEIVPTVATKEMVDAALGAGRGVRSAVGAHDIWLSMLAASPIRLRQPLPLDHEDK